MLRCKEFGLRCSENLYPTCHVEGTSCPHIQLRGLVQWYPARHKNTDDQVHIKVMYTHLVFYTILKEPSFR